MKKTGALTLALAALLALAGCAPAAPAAEASPAASASPTPARTATPTPKPSATPTPVPNNVALFECSGSTLSVTGRTYFTKVVPTLEAAWTLPDVEFCSPRMSTGKPYSALEKAAAEAAGYTVDKVSVLWDICADVAGFLQTTGPINDAQRKETNAALILCPNHPAAQIMANGSPEQAEREQGLRFANGVREVGSQVQPGTYRASGEITNCYWARLDAAGGIIANNFVSAATQVEVTVDASDFSLQTDGCGEFVKVG